MYADLGGWSEEHRTRVESTWPEYKDSAALLSQRSYLVSTCSPAEWCNTYLKDHVQTIQEMKQHHVHIMSSKGERLPLAHCQRADNPKECKSDFPRTKWIISRAVVLCAGLMKKMGMPLGGKRNKLGRPVFIICNGNM